MRSCVLECPDARHLYQFPSAELQPERRKEWLRLFDMEECGLKNLYACDRHFSLYMKGSKRLIFTAIPDLNIKAKKLPKYTDNTGHTYCFVDQDVDQADPNAEYISYEDWLCLSPGENCPDPPIMTQATSSSLLNLTREFLQFLKKRNGVCTLRQALYSMDEETQQRFDDIYQVLVGAGILEESYPKNLLKLRSYIPACTQPKLPLEPALKSPAPKLCTKSVEIKTEVQTQPMDEVVDTIVSAVSTKSVEIQTDLQLTPMDEVVDTSVLIPPQSDQTICAEHTTAKTVLDSLLYTSLKVNRETQTDSTRLCGFVEMSMDNKVKFLNCFYCKEVVPISNWHSFSSHIRDNHLGRDLKYIETEDTSAVATNATDTASNSKESNKTNLKVAKVNLLKTQVITAKSHKQPIATISKHPLAAPQVVRATPPIAQKNLMGYVTNTHKQSAEVLVQSVDDLIELVLDDAEQTSVPTETMEAPSLAAPCTVPKDVRGATPITLKNSPNTLTTGVSGVAPIFNSSTFEPVAELGNLSASKLVTLTALDAVPPFSSFTIVHLNVHPVAAGPTVQPAVVPTVSRAAKNPIEFVSTGQMETGKLAITYTEYSDEDIKPACPDLTSSISNTVNADIKVIKDLGVALQTVADIEDSPSKSFKRKVEEDVTWDFEPLSEVESLESIYITPTAPTSPKIIKATIGDVQPESATEMTSTAVKESKMLEIIRNEITCSEASDTDSDENCDNTSKTTQTAAKAKSDQILFKRTNPSVVMDFLEQFKTRPVLWNNQGSIKAYNAAINDLTKQLNESWNLSFTQTSISRSLRRVRDWYCHVLYKRSLLEKAEDYQHKFPQYFDKCAEFLPKASMGLPCEYCELRSHNFISLQTHKFKAHGVGNLYFASKHCGTRFADTVQLALHEMKHYEPKSKPKPIVKPTSKLKPILIPSPKQYTCSTCNQTFLSEFLLQGHLQAHEQDPRRVCNVCSKVFSTVAICQQHTILHAEPMHRCDICSKRFYKLPQLKVHLKRHRQERDYICEYCGKGFVRNTDLQSHCKGVHQMEIVCKICNQTFNSPTLLWSHNKRTHFVYEGTNEDLERITSKGFKRMTRITDPITQERLLLCEICNATFKKQNPFHYHRAKMHGIQRTKHPNFHKGKRIAKGARQKILTGSSETTTNNSNRNKKRRNKDLLESKIADENESAAATIATEMYAIEKMETNREPNNNDSKEIEHIDDSNIANVDQRAAVAIGTDISDLDLFYMINENIN